MERERHKQKREGMAMMHNRHVRNNTTFFFTLGGYESDSQRRKDEKEKDESIITLFTAVSISPLLLS